MILFQVIRILNLISSVFKISTAFNIEISIVSSSSLLTLYWLGRLRLIIKFFILSLRRNIWFRTQIKKDKTRNVSYDTVEYTIKISYIWREPFWQRKIVDIPAPLSWGGEGCFFQTLCLQCSCYSSYSLWRLRNVYKNDARIYLTYSLHSPLSSWTPKTNKYCRRRF